MKGYVIDIGYMGKTTEKYMPFPTETEYIELMREKEKENNNNGK